jgi:hypothetical protein
MDKAKLAKPYLTRAELPKYIEWVWGVPVSRSALEKLRVKPDKYYGRQGLYSADTAAKIAKELISDHPVNLGLNRAVTEHNPNAA